MSFTVINGVATIDQSSGSQTFCGSTGDGRFPPPGQRYHKFTFKPKAGENGILVFEDETMTRIMERRYYHFYQYYWKKGKLIVEYDINLSPREYSKSDESGFLVQFRNWCYVTEVPTDTGHNYKVVELFDMLKYIEGKIELKELGRNARLYKQRQERAQNTRQLKRQAHSDSTELVILRSNLFDLQEQFDRCKGVVMALPNGYLPRLLQSWAVQELHKLQNSFAKN